MSMLKSEYAIGDYLQHEAKDNYLGIKRETRKSMVKLLEKISNALGYKNETLFLSVSLADRYLAKR